LTYHFFPTLLSLLIIIFTLPSSTVAYLPLQEIKDAEKLLLTHIQDPYPNNFTLSYPSLHLNLTFSNIKPTTLKLDLTNTSNGLQYAYINFYNYTSVFVTHLSLIDTTNNIRLFTIPYFSIEYFFDYLSFVSQSGGSFSIGIRKVVDSIHSYTKNLEGYELFNELITNNKTDFHNKLNTLYFEFLELIVEKYLRGKFMRMFNEVVREIDEVWFKRVSFDEHVHDIRITNIDYAVYSETKSFGKFDNVKLDIELFYKDTWGKTRVYINDIYVYEQNIVLLFPFDEEDWTIQEKVVEELFTITFNNIK
jgi:hypothetical protein